MVIGDQQSITNFAPAQKGGKATNTDHKPQFLEVNIKFVPSKPQNVKF